jgi:hypothetical protein
VITAVETQDGVLLKILSVWLQNLYRDISFWMSDRTPLLVLPFTHNLNYLKEFYKLLWIKLRQSSYSRLSEMVRQQDIWTSLKQVLPTPYCAGSLLKENAFLFLQFNLCNGTTLQCSVYLKLNMHPHIIYCQMPCKIHILFMLTRCNVT